MIGIYIYNCNFLRLFPLVFLHSAGASSSAVCLPCSTGTYSGSSGGRLWVGLCVCVCVCLGAISCICITHPHTPTVSYPAR